MSIVFTIFKYGLTGLVVFILIIFFFFIMILVEDVAKEKEDEKNRRKNMAKSEKWLSMTEEEKTIDKYKKRKRQRRIKMLKTIFNIIFLTLFCFGIGLLIWGGK